MKAQNENPGALAGATGADGKSKSLARNTPKFCEIQSVYAACVGNVRAEHIARMRALGIGDDLLFGNWPAMFGMAKIKPLACGLFDFADDGDPAVIVPCCTYYEVAEMFPFDLLAFRTLEPTHWWLWRGDAVLLNDAETDRVSLFEEPLFVAETPLSWLQHGARGVCVLDWTASLPLHLGQQPIIAETIDLGRKIEDAYRRRCAAPPIRIAQQGIAA